MVNNPPQPIPVDESFLSKWLYGFRDNEYQNINEGTFRTFATDINSKFARLDTLNTNQVRGSLYRVPFVVYENGLPTVLTDLIPPRFRILGMDVRATNGTDATSVLAGVKADPLDFRLLAYSAGTIDALVDEQATTTTTVKAHWVRTSGTEEEKMASFPGWVEEDHPYLEGDVFQYTFEDLVPSVTRLFKVKADMNLTQNPPPTGTDADDYYKPFAPLSSGPTVTVRQTLATPSTDAVSVDAVVAGLQGALGEYALATVASGGTVLSFDRCRNYGELQTGTFTIDPTGARLEVTATIYLAAACTEPLLPPSFFENVGGTTFTAGQKHLYMFMVGGNDKYQYIVRPLP